MNPLTLTLILVICTGAFAAGSYNYADVFSKSFLFYEAQRSGKLPKDQRVKWRKDSALGDKGQNGEDLTGGYYDAGDFVKFGFPMAFTTTVIAWGQLEFPNGYQSANQVKYGQQMIRWATDYFLKCHVSTNVFYGQVANSKLDHDYWGRPQDMKMKRPAYKIDSSHPGSDLASETAAALTASSLVLKSSDSAYASNLLNHAKQLYAFAKKYRGLYHKSITDAKDNYESSGDGDEMAWAAAWLYKATGSSSYLNDAKKFYKQYSLSDRPTEFSWDSKNAGVQVLMMELTGESSYRKDVQTFCDYMVHKQKRTPKGLVFIDNWGSLGHAANIAYICLVAAEKGINANTYRSFAKQQFGYILGDTGRSFVVGFGKNYPKRPQHASSDCPDAPAPCNWDTFSSNQPNAHVLYGALVGGPDKNDNYKDDRQDYVHNEVADDYNSGFTSALAGLVQLKSQGKI